MQKALCRCFEDMERLVFKYTIKIKFKTACLYAHLTYIHIDYEAQF